SSVKARLADNIGLSTNPHPDSYLKARLAAYYLEARLASKEVKSNQAIIPYATESPKHTRITTRLLSHDKGVMAFRFPYTSLDRILEAREELEVLTNFLLLRRRYVLGKGATILGGAGLKRKDMPSIKPPHLRRYRGQSYPDEEDSIGFIYPKDYARLHGYYFTSTNEDIARTLYNMASTLNYLYNETILYNNIKLSNILYNRGRSLVLIDFRLASTYSDPPYKGGTP
ncbi:hypothetical protein TPAR_08577, partial [Tolypocladium paradoxum]